MIDFQLQQAAFKFGIDEGTDPHSLPMGVLLTLENYAWLKSGRVEKRSGVTPISNSVTSGGTIAAGKRLFTRDNELCAVDGSNLFAFSPSQGAWRNIGAGTAGAVVGSVNEASLTWSTLSDSSTGIRMSSIAAKSGRVIHAWITGDASAIGPGNLYMEVFDATTRARLTSGTLASNSLIETVAVVTLGNSAIVVAKQQGTIFAFAIDLSTFALTTTVLRNDARLGVILGGCDAVVINDTSLVIAYEKNAAAGLQFYSYTLSAGVFTQTATSTVTVGGNTISPISIDGIVGEVIYAGFYVQSTLKTRVATVDASTLAASGAATDVPGTGGDQYIGVTRFDATHCMLLYTNSTRLVTNACVFAGNVHTHPDITPITRPFVVGGLCYFYGYYGATGIVATPFAGGDTVLVDCSVTLDSGGIDRYLGTVDLLVGGHWSPGSCCRAPIAGSTALAPLPYLSDAASSYVNWRCGAHLTVASFGSSVAPDQWRSISCVGEAVFCGGSLSVYDGRNTFDYNFPCAPIPVGPTITPTAAKVGIGTYLYSFVQEQRSHVGLLHRSSPSAPVTVNLTASSTVQWQISGVSLGTKQGFLTGYGASNEAPTYVATYRTVAGGTLPQRLTFEPGYGTAVVDPRAASLPLVILDDKPDTNIGGSVALATRPVLYGIAGAGALDDYQAPAGVTLFYHADRIFQLAGNMREWWFSKTYQDDLGTAPGFHPSFRIVFLEDQVCGASMDEKAIFFSATGIRYMLGLGPAKDGTNSDFSTPIRIQSDVGCTNPRSVVSVPDGIMFLSARGIYMLTRGLELDWTGRKIQSTLLLYPNITSATLVALKSEVRFTANAADGLSGVTLVYNYVEHQWSVFKYLQVAGVGTPIADACMYLGAWTFITPTGGVYAESSDSLDNGVYVNGVVETAWISAGGPCAYTSVAELWLHGSSQSDHELTLEAAFNSDPAYKQTRTFRAGSKVTTVGPLEECRLSIGARRKCDSIRFRITDSAPLTPGSVLGSGKGPKLETMAILAGLLKGDDSPAGRKG